MSQENVDSIRAGMVAWNRGDWDEALKDAAPDIVLDNSSNAGRVARSPLGAGTGEADVGEIR
jgi:hypothetical protein